MRQFLITGASKGIGQAAALELARAGCLLQFDVADRVQCEQVLSTYQEEHGAVYGIVCNAGITRDSAFPAMSAEEWDSVLTTDLDGFFNVVKPCMMPMIGAHQGGRIIVISSVSGLSGNRGQVNYSAAKAGLIGAAKALAVELAKRKITVNAVAPGLIDTAMAQLSEPALKAAMGMIPMQRMGRPEEVAAVIGFLASDRASYVTRQVISVNGGML